MLTLIAYSYPLSQEKAREILKKNGYFVGQDEKGKSRPINVGELWMLAVRFLWKMQPRLPILLILLLFRRKVTVTVCIQRSVFQLGFSTDSR